MLTPHEPIRPLSFPLPNIVQNSQQHRVKHWLSLLPPEIISHLPRLLPSSCPTSVCAFTDMLLPLWSLSPLSQEPSPPLSPWASPPWALRSDWASFLYCSFSTASMPVLTYTWRLPFPVGVRFRWPSCLPSPGSPFPLCPLMDETACASF